ncbi:MAG: hypothetical protein ACI9JL_002319 [Paracoccaceae bacterium]|jgi:hypothetical protein
MDAHELIQKLAPYYANMKMNRCGRLWKPIQRTPCPPLLLNPETPNLRTDLVYVRAYMSALLHQPRQEERQAGDQHDQRNSNDVGRNEGQHAPEYLG